MKGDADGSIRDVCLSLNERVQAFLEEEPEDELVRKVQAQTRVALGVITTALEKYRFVSPLFNLWKRID